MREAAARTLMSDDDQIVGPSQNVTAQSVMAAAVSSASAEG